MSDVNIFNEELIEFEFDKFSIFYDKKRQTWYLESTETEADFSVVLTPESIEKNKKELQKLNFEIEQLTKVQSFLQGTKNDKNKRF